MNPITMIVINWVKPGCEAEYRRCVEPVLDAMRHEITFVNTILHQDAEDPTRFMLYETWADHDDFFVKQMKKSYRSEYERILPSLLRVPREISFFEALRADFNFYA
ncbi:MAG: antibiotic biosynthesis monooxygenase [Gammaproteobacteria bacterium]|nr:antibiotic biosynthesis monooxygenase [Gammaproteobacteria bacterium]